MIFSFSFKKVSSCIILAFLSKRAAGRRQTDAVSMRWQPPCGRPSAAPGQPIKRLRQRPVPRAFVQIQAALVLVFCFDARKQAVRLLIKIAPLAGLQRYAKAQTHKLRPRVRSTVHQTQHIFLGIVEKRKPRHEQRAIAARYRFIL